MAGDLDRPGGPDVHDDHRLVGAQAMNPHPHDLKALVNSSKMRETAVD